MQTCGSPEVSIQEVIYHISDAGDVPQFITWRLADALPASLLAAWSDELVHAADPERKKVLAQRIEAYCDPGYFAPLIRDSKHFDGVRRYLEWNPVKAKLCADPKRWVWSSACPEARARLDVLLNDRAKG